MAIGQFTEITISNRSSDKTLKIQNLTMKWGKIYPEGNKNGPEISPADVENTEIKPKKSYVFRTCGRSDSASGTEGYFDLNVDDKMVRNIYWSSPWGVSDNIFKLSGEDEDWMAEVRPAGNQGGNAGPLGVVGCTLVYLG
ncbi:MAG: hypothetical protein MMC33_005121 [Icmadophila ericetorum]|nr:hypothetical protein [Icmadophila ericetorum]